MSDQTYDEMAAELGVSRDEIVSAALRVQAWKQLDQKHMFRRKKKKDKPVPSPDDQAEPICVGDRNHDDYGFAKGGQPDTMTPERKAELEKSLREAVEKNPDLLTDLKKPHKAHSADAVLIRTDEEAVRKSIGKKDPELLRSTRERFQQAADSQERPTMEERAQQYATEAGIDLKMVPNPFHVPEEDRQDPIPRLAYGENIFVGPMQALANWVRRQIERAVQPRLVLKFKLVGEGAKMPTKKRATDVGIDFYTNIPWPVYINPGDGYTFPTGVKPEVPRGWGLLFRDRSGLGSSLIGHTAGVLDSEFRGELMVTLVNHGRYQREFLPGDKIIQGVLVRVPDVDLRNVDDHPEEDGTLSPSDRGEKGFGSSGR